MNEEIKGYKFLFETYSFKIGISKISGLTENVYNDNVLIVEHGICLDEKIKYFYDWYKLGRKKDVKISVFNKDINSKIEWYITGAIPIKHEHGELDTSSSNVVIEKLHLKFSKIKRVVKDKNKKYLRMSDIDRSKIPIVEIPGNKPKDRPKILKNDVLKY